MRLVTTTATMGLVLASTFFCSCSRQDGPPSASSRGSIGAVGIDPGMADPTDGDILLTPSDSPVPLDAPFGGRGRESENDRAYQQWVRTMRTADLRLRLGPERTAIEYYRQARGLLESLPENVPDHRVRTGSR